MQNHTNKNSHGFTAIELMIVVAIIGILAALFIPAFIGYSRKYNPVTYNCSEVSQKALNDYENACMAGGRSYDCELEAKKRFCVEASAEPGTMGAPN